MSYKPEHTSLLSPYIVVDDAAAAIDFYAKAFGATEVMRLNMPDTETVMHAEIAIDGATIMLSQANPAWGTKSPKALGGSPVSLHLYVPDVDAALDRAVKAGATAEMPATDMFWGDRMGSVQCPFGFKWSLATHKRIVSPDEIEAGARAMMQNPGNCGAAEG